MVVSEYSRQNIAISSAIFVTFALTLASSQCCPGWYAATYYCYKLYNTSQMKWQEGVAGCASTNPPSRLPIINNAAENTDLHNYM